MATLSLTRLCVAMVTTCMISNFNFSLNWCDFYSDVEQPTRVPQQLVAVSVAYLIYSVLHVKVRILYV